MAEYTKKLHYLKNGATQDIQLYTSLSDVVDANANTPALRLKDGNTTVYAKLGSTSDSNASHMRVKANNTTYAVFKQARHAKGDALNVFTWDEISEIALSGEGAEYFNIGDCKEITLNGKVGNYLTLSNTKLCVFILDINHPMNGVAENNIIFGGFKTALTNGTDVALTSKYYQNPKDGSILFNMCHGGWYNFGGWKGCHLRYDILGATSTAPSGAADDEGRIGYDATAATLTSPKANTLLAALPSDLRSNMRLWTRYVDAVGNSSDVDANIKATVDAITLLAEPEIFASRTYANKYEYNHNTRMAYYANGNSTIKMDHLDGSDSVQWWEISPCYQNGSNFCRVYSNGDPNHCLANYSLGLAPAFKI